MGQVQSSAGLISGLNITQTVNNLMQLSSGPVNSLTAQNTQLQNQDTAYTQLSAELLALQADAKALQQNALYTSRSATSSDSTALAATVTGTPVLGTYEFTPLQAVQSQQLLSNGLQSETNTLGGGTLSFRFGTGLAQSTQLSSLNGGQGFGQLGTLDLTDRSGATGQANLSGAQTIGAVINAINQAGTGITAKINAAGDGIELVDNSVGTGDMIVADDLSDTSAQAGSAARLGIAVNGAVNSVNSGDLHLQTVSMNTLLSSFNGGAGVAQGTVNLTNSSGQMATLTVDSSMQTIGDVINTINSLSQANGLDIQAGINSTGDGILLTDSSGGPGVLNVAEGNSTTAQDLNLLQTASPATQNSQPVQVIDGGMTHTIKLAAGDSLEDLVTNINKLNAGVTASVVNDGSSTPYRLSLTSNQPGTAGAVVVDASQMGVPMSFTETVKPQNALVALGNAADPSSSIQASSSSNNFTDLLPGVTLQVGQPTGQPVQIAVGVSNTALTNTVQSLVNDYNSFNTTMTTDTSYDTTSNTGAILADDPTTTQLSSDLSAIFNGQIFGDGSVQSLAQLGITSNQDGSLSFDSSQLQNAYASNPNDVKQFFSQKNTGFAVQLDTLVNNLAGQNNSLLSTRMNSISDIMSQNSDKITSLNTMLDNQRQLLYNQFYQMEVALAQMQTSMSIVNTLSMVNSDGSSTNVFGDNVTNSLSNLSNLASVISGTTASQAAAATSSTTSGTNSSGSSSSS